LAGSLLAPLRCAAPCQSRSPVTWPPSRYQHPSQAVFAPSVRSRCLSSAGRALPASRSARSRARVQLLDDVFEPFLAERKSQQHQEPQQTRQRLPLARGVAIWRAAPSGDPTSRDAFLYLDPKSPAHGGLPSVRPWRACHVLRAHRGFAGAAHRRQVVTPQMGYSFLFDAKQLRPRLTWLLASTPAFYEAYRQWTASLAPTEPASSDRNQPNASAP